MKENAVSAAAGASIDLTRLFGSGPDHFVAGCKK